MKTLDLSSYSRETLEHILTIMKSYRTSLKQIGKRTILMDYKNPPALRARVEYPTSLDVGSAGDYAKACIKYAFPEYRGEAPILEKNDALKGGARVFVGDDMVDVSFQKFETLIKK